MASWLERRHACAVRAVRLEERLGARTHADAPARKPFGRPRGRQGLWGFARAGRFGGGGAALVLVTPCWDSVSSTSLVASAGVAPRAIPTSTSFGRSSSSFAPCRAWIR